MKWKRPVLLISGTVMGTVGVLSYTPTAPDDGGLLSLSPSDQAATSQTTQTTQTTQNPVAPTTTNTQSASTAPAPTATKTTTKTITKATQKKSTKTKSASATTSTPEATSTPKPTPPASATPTPTATTPAPQTSARTIAGSTIQTKYGPVQVQITVQGTKITNAAALQIPQGGRSTWINNQAVPWLIQQTLAAQSANVQGVGGATFTSRSWAQSLQAAIGKI